MFVSNRGDRFAPLCVYHLVCKKRAQEEEIKAQLCSTVFLGDGNKTILRPRFIRTRGLARALRLYKDYK